MSITSVSVSFRKDRDKWQVSYWHAGIRKRPLFVSEKEAHEFSGKLKRSSVDIANKDSITIDAAINSYYADVTLKKKSRQCQKGEKRYFNLLFHFMTVERGIDLIQSIGLQDLEAFQMWLLEQKTYDNRPMDMGPSSVNRAFNSIRHMFKKHVQWQNLKSSPCIYLDNLQFEENERRPMTPAEFVKARAKAPAWYQPTLKFIHHTGTPPSCIERLTWLDVNIEGRSYAIRREKGGKIARIEMQMSDAVLQLFIEQRHKFNDSCLAVFRNAHGGPLTAEWCSRAGNDAIHAAGLEGVTLYCLRHALATDLTSANVSTELVRQAMGHRSISTTQRYSRRANKGVIAGALTLVRGDVESPRCHHEMPEGDTTALVKEI